MDENRALIIVDVQPTFCEGGALAVDGGNAVAERIADFVTENSDEYTLIVTTQDWHIEPGEHFSTSPDFVDTWPPHGVAGSAEAELHDAVASLPIDASVKKGQYAAAYSGFEGKDEDERSLEDILREAGIQEVDVVGIAESHCVKETALDALRLGWPTRVLSDLTVPVTAEQGEEARAELDEAGVEQIASSTAFGFYDEGEDAPIPDGFGGEAEVDDDYEDEDFDQYDDDYEDEDFEEDEAVGVGALGGALAAAGDGFEFDLDDLDMDLDEDIDFSDEADESDFDFSDIDYTPGQ